MPTRRVPPELRKLRGSPSDIRDIQLIPGSVGDLWAPPAWFDAEERAAWAHALETAPPGLLTASDRGPLTVWVQASVNYKRARVGARGAQVIADGPHDSIKLNPLVTVAAMEARQMMASAKELGFTPGSRLSMGMRSAANPSALSLDTTTGSLAGYLGSAPEIKQ